MCLTGIMDISKISQLQTPDPPNLGPWFHILEQGRNTWRIGRADRAAFLVDTESYFSAFAEAVLNAEHTILICGWDIDSRVELFRDNSQRDFPTQLGQFLNWIVTRRPELNAYVLTWDFSMIYAFERELLPALKLGWRTHDRLHFRMDGSHPMGASHHQKIVVIDDSIAFVGGIDLTKCRWDTPEHSPGDPRRNDPGCSHYRPFHDVQMIVDSEAAWNLGQLARQRWFRATGKTIPPPPIIGGDPWPRRVIPDMERVRIGIARTEPLYKDYPEVREIETLYIDSINAARKYIYMENQYLTSSLICEVLSARLKEANCPEIVMVLPYRSSGWLETGTMDALRTRVLKKLRAADKYGRLRIYYPRTAGLEDVWINLHSKLCIIDDRLVRVGSSNLSNRSMGFDTECDLAIEADNGDETADGIRRFLARLLGEHLGVSQDQVMETIEKTGSLIGAIEGLRNGDRTLEDLDGLRVEEIFDSYVYETSLIDPECPAPPAELIDQFVPDEIKRSGIRPAIWGILTLLFLLGLAAMWTWTPLKHRLDLDSLLRYSSFLAETRTAPLIVLAIYLVGGILHFPVTLLIVATAVTFGPFTAFFYSLVGCLSSAALCYWLGMFFGRDAVRKFGGDRVNRLSRRLAKHGLLTMIMIRIFPVGPFSFFNLVAGVSHIRFRDFILGSTIGLLPGLIMITLLGGHLGETLRHPKIENFLLFTGLAILFIAANIMVRRWLERRKNGKGPGVGM
jgi:phospholipase D1/2